MELVIMSIRFQVVDLLLPIGCQNVAIIALEPMVHLYSVRELFGVVFLVSIITFAHVPV